MEWTLYYSKESLIEEYEIRIIKESLEDCSNCLLCKGKSTAMVSNSDASKDNLHLDGFEKDDLGAVWGGRTPSFEYSNFLANGKRG